MPPEAVNERVRRELTRRLAEALMENAVVRYEERPQTDSVRIRAEVRVLPNQEQEE